MINRDLQCLGLQSRATDFGSCHACTCLEATVWDPTVLRHRFWLLSRTHLSGGYSLGAYSLEPWTFDLVTHSLIWRRHSGGLQAHATNFGFCYAITCLEATIWGPTVSSHGFCILSRTHWHTFPSYGLWNLSCTHLYERRVIEDRITQTSFRESSSVE